MEGRHWWSINVFIKHTFWLNLHKKLIFRGWTKRWIWSQQMARTWIKISRKKLSSNDLDNDPNKKTSKPLTVAWRSWSQLLHFVLILGCLEASVLTLLIPGNNYFLVNRTYLIVNETIHHMIIWKLSYFWNTYPLRAILRGLYDRFCSLSLCYTVIWEMDFFLANFGNILPLYVSFLFCKLTN